MSTRRAKKPVETITKEECDAQIKIYAEADSKIKKIESDVELQIQRGREKKAAELATLKQNQKEAMDKLFDFAKVYRDEYFSKLKSMVTLHGIIGFRNGTPTVKMRGTTVKNAVAALKLAGLPFVSITTKEELDKNAIIAKRDDKETIEKLGTLGIRVVTEESFYIEPKAENYEQMPG